MQKDIKVEPTGIWRFKKKEEGGSEGLERQEKIKREKEEPKIVSRETKAERKDEEQRERAGVEEEFDRDYFESGTKSNYKGYPDPNILKMLQGKADLIEKFFPSNRAVLLEVGCAKGFLVKMLREKGFKVFGIDISGYAIQNAEESIKSFVQIADIRERLPFKDNEFNGVLSVDVLEHIEEEKIGLVLKELKRVGQKQLHFVTFGEGLDPNDKDKTHKTMKPQEWWGKKFLEADIAKENFSVPSL